MTDKRVSNHPVSLGTVSLVAAAVAALLTAPLAHASPVVNGSKISWPDDGWYQVQTADGLTNICEGTRSCVVEPGQYIVINHTTGKRYTPVLIPDAPMVEVVSVNGNTISWPDDGWYQVQSASTYESLCQGGLSCTVENGSYIVINHTTGERFTDIAVHGDTGIEEPPTQASFDLLEVSQDLIVTAAGYQLDKLAVVVDDLAFFVSQQVTIQWPDDSWYQVQNPETYESVCNGGVECKVVPGSYMVINHSTGERSALDVPYVSPADQPGATQLAETTTTYTLPQDPTNISTPVTTARTHYSCENGGSLILERGNQYEARFYNEFGSDVGGVADKNGYVFDDCAMTLQNGLLPDGNYVINGNLQNHILYSYGDSQSNTFFDDFSIVGDNGVAYRVHGQTEDVDGYDFNYLRSATIGEYQAALPDVEENESISDVTFNYETLNNTTVLAAPWKTLTVNGIVRNAQTASQTVTIATPSVMIWGSEPFMPFSGSIEMQAEDGSFLYQTASAYTDPDDFWALFIDFDYTAANGEQTQLLQEKYYFPFGYGEPSCFYDRSATTGRLSCPDDYRD